MGQYCNPGCDPEFNGQPNSECKSLCGRFPELAEQSKVKLDAHHKLVTSLDWELQQATIHLKTAISLADPAKAHLLTAALQITKGVRESE